MKIKGTNKPPKIAITESFFSKFCLLYFNINFKCKYTNGNIKNRARKKYSIFNKNFANVDICGTKLILITQVSHQYFP